MNTDVAVVGAGIVGLATALSITEHHPDISVTVIDKERSEAAHQTGHNSGVLHTGIYYRPGSQKARLCVDGRRRMIEFCADHSIPTAITGKIVVAADGTEVGRMEELHRRASVNGVSGVERIDAAGIRGHEPHATGAAALWVPEAGTVDFKVVASTMRRLLEARGVVFRLGKPVTASTRRGSTVELTAGSEQVTAERVVACAGLHSDRVARLLGLEPPVSIVPFRGEYWHLRRPDLVRSLVYPVPDPRFPFLGVHYTKGIDGQVEVGPNAVPAFAREGYSWGRINPSDAWSILRTPGLGTLARTFWKTGLAEIARSLTPPMLVKAARTLIPDVTSGDLVRAGAGVRAQALKPDGTLADDFEFAEGDGVLAVVNAPSPAATASLSIGDEIAGRLLG